MNRYAKMLSASPGQTSGCGVILRLNCNSDYRGIGGTDENEKKVDVF